MMMNVRISQGLLRGCYFLLPILVRVSCQHIVPRIITCNSTIELQCSDDKEILHILNTNEMSNITTRFIELCNARKSCQLHNGNNECIEVTYNCVPDIPALEIKSSSTQELQSSSSLFYLMSEGYRLGKQQFAQRVECHLKSDIGGNNTQVVQFSFLEFTSFDNTSVLCLRVLDNSTVPYCSESNQTHYGLFQSHTGWSFQLQLAEKDRQLQSPGQSDRLSTYRFWIAIAGFENDAMYSLKCTSDAASIFGIVTKILLSLVIFFHPLANNLIF